MCREHRIAFAATVVTFLSLPLRAGESCTSEFKNPLVAEASPSIRLSPSKYSQPNARRLLDYELTSSRLGVSRNLRGIINDVKSLPTGVEVLDSGSGFGLAAFEIANLRQDIQVVAVNAFNNWDGEATVKDSVLSVFSDILGRSVDPDQARREIRNKPNFQYIVDMSQNFLDSNPNRFYRIWDMYGGYAYSADRVAYLESAYQALLNRDGAEARVQVMGFQLGVSDHKVILRDGTVTSLEIYIRNFNERLSNEDQGLIEIVDLQMFIRRKPGRPRLNLGLERDVDFPVSYSNGAQFPVGVVYREI